MEEKTTQNNFEEENSILVTGAACDICGGPHPHPHDHCDKSTTQCADVSVPFKVKPFANVGRVETECFGPPRIAFPRGDKCSDFCEFIITQTVCVKIPISFGAETDIGRSYIDCKKAPQ